MKAHFHLVPRNTQFPYLARQHTLPNFGTVWHYHPELELHYIIRGEGVRFVGDNISNFDAEELLLLGENLPHMWRCNKQYFEGNPDVTAEAIVVHFLPDFMGADFLSKQEATAVHALYERAQSGLIIHGKTKKEILNLMQESVQQEGMSRLITILNMVHILANSKETTKITSGLSSYHANKDETDRINKIYHYILSNYRDEISLEEISSVAHLSVTSFCRYFKMMTKKTFRDFLIEVRISHAKRILIENNIPTTESICFECGFNNRSNFFRHFKRITGCTPIEYRQRYLYENVFV
ncbi:helix-turn-helix transcriptional regulator [Sphingobacterium sp. SGG-5]|uniref:AraC family transcriptional regulator n=1 Tax=Sphingobacterium sp. SGG-5 TaxID=2710881 RepID=UPI0013EA4A97|nr:AraC family transcriptional regulator [Sphingobacterium sp. SGG-5]NGM60430.1 helix-turn-helix transcriptional regulator [Sphingobacterium sp. SGG-5]